MKHFLRLKGVITFFVLTISMNVNAHDFETGGIYYNFNDDGSTVSVTYYSDIVGATDATKYSGDIVIPDSVISFYSDKVYAVTAIGSMAFKGCHSVTSVTLPNTIKTIDSYAFQTCSLKSINIPGSVTKIGYDAFYGCGLERVDITDLKAWCSLDFGHSGWNNPLHYARNLYLNGKLVRFLKIPEGVTSIKKYSFDRCTSIYSVTIPNSVTKIDECAFNACSGLTSIVIPGSVSSIGREAFYECTALTSLTLEDGVDSIGISAFYGCGGLQSVSIPNSVTSLGSNAFWGCYNLTSVILPNNLTSISGGLFRGCKFKSITIPSSVRSIGSQAFYSCKNLTSVDLSGTSVGSIGFSAFEECENLASVTFPKGTLTKIEYYAFKRCFALKSLTIPYYLTSIGSEAFYGCTALTSIKCDNSTPCSMGAGAFSYLNKNNCTIYVPKGSMSAYKSASVWGEFPNIQEYAPYYKVVYLIDGEEYYTVDVSFMSKIPAVDTPVKEGYTFTGWSEVPATMPMENITVTGSFKINSYSLKYVVDGEVIDSTSVAYGTKITAITGLIKEGYTFSWSEIPTTMPAEDVTITGSFSVNSYSLKYVVDGEVVDSTSVEYGTELTALDEPTKEGHTFCGWSEIPTTMPAEDVTITGSFSVNSYSLKYVVDGEVVDSASVAYGTELVAIAEPVKEGHTFSGWSEIHATMPAEDVTVTGSFKVNSYVVKYVVDGEVVDSASVAYGTELVAIAEPVKEGHTFSGWSEIHATMPAEDVTVTGSFSVNSYSLKYVVDGEVVDSTSVEYGTELVAIAEPVKEGHTFSGWSWIPAKMPAEDVTVTGSFTINTYKVIYMVDGEEYEVVEVKYGGAIPAVDEPKKEGYEFSGWSEIPETMPAEDITVTGSFTVIDAIWGVMMDDCVDVYNLNGLKVASNMAVKDLETELEKGVYIINGKKYLIK